MTSSETEAPDPRAELQIALALGFFIVVSIVLRIAVRHRSSLGPDWLVPAVEIGLLILLLLADPARVSRRSRWLRWLAIALVAPLAAAALASASRTWRCGFSCVAEREMVTPL